MLAPPPRPSNRSSFAEYLKTKPHPPPEWHHYEHPTYAPTYPETLLLTFLPKAALLTLRLVSRANSAMVATALFTTLHIEFPTTSLSHSQSSALNNIAQHCSHLTITFPTSSPSKYALPSPTSETSIFPPLPNLTHIHLTCPPTNTLERLHAFHLALQRIQAPQLTNLHIANLSISGILALRCGGFTSLGDSHWTDKQVWRKIESLDVEVVPWWDAQWWSEFQVRGETADRAQKERWCTGIKVLHDWLGSFARMHVLKELMFEWQGVEGPNPLLLDEVAVGIGRGRWFSAPPVRWRGLREVWLGGVGVEVEDLGVLKGRMEGLERLMVQSAFVGEGNRGWRRVVDGKAWFEVFLGKEDLELQREGLVELVGDWPDMGVVDRNEGLGRVNVSRASTMSVPLVLDHAPILGSQTW